MLIYRYSAGDCLAGKSRLKYDIERFAPFHFTNFKLIESRAEICNLQFISFRCSLPSPVWSAHPLSILFILAQHQHQLNTNSICANLIFYRFFPFLEAVIQNCCNLGSLKSFTYNLQFPIDLLHISDGKLAYAARCQVLALQFKANHLQERILMIDSSKFKHIKLFNKRLDAQFTLVHRDTNSFTFEWNAAII